MPEKDENSKEIILGSMVNALNRLESCADFALLMPEVRVNLVYALPEAVSPQEVAAVEGRITTVRGLPRAAGLPSFGASDHMARLIIEARRYNGEINAGINFKCDEGVIAVVGEYCRGRGIICGRIDRSGEPDSVSRVDGHSMPWKIAQLYQKYSRVPTVFYEDAGWGKEPLYVVLGQDAGEVVATAIEIARCYAEGR